MLASAVFLIRKIPAKARAAYNGVWLKDSADSYEIRGKTLGLIGFGNIGSQVAILAEAFGMHVIYYDLDPKLSFGNAKATESMREILQASDIVSLHVPLNADTDNLIGKEELSEMKPGSHLINFSRGSLVDLEALAHFLKNGHIGGAAIDVFPVEPKDRGAAFESPLQGLENVILTPHIGGSTEEAQWNIGLEVATKLVGYLDEGKSVGSVSIPELSQPKMEGTRRVLNIHRNVPGVIGHMSSLIHEQGLNIRGQYLNTDEYLGYVVVDVDETAGKEQLDALKETKETIRHRVLY